MAGVIPMNGYLTPEQAAMMAGIEDPGERMNTLGGMQRFANMLPQMNQIKERSNGRVVGRTDPMEGLAQMGSQLAGAYMNKSLMDKYGAIMDTNNQQRMSTAKMIADALRRAPAAGAAAPGTAQSYPVTPQSPPVTAPMTSYTPHEIDYYGGY